jgi:hypothetical protein
VWGFGGESTALAAEYPHQLRSALAAEVRSFFAHDTAE